MLPAPERAVHLDQQAHIREAEIEPPPPRARVDVRHMELADRAELHQLDELVRERFFEL
jgi:hypothetical protein